MDIQLTEFIQQHFGIKPLHIKQLVGYENLNYKISTQTQHYTLKVYPDIKILEAVTQQTNALAHIHTKGDFLNKYSKPIKFSTGEYLKILVVNGKESVVRLLTYVPGQLLDDVPRTPELTRSIGRCMVELLGLLEDAEFKDKPDFEWKMQNFHLLKGRMEYVKDEEEKKMIVELLGRYEEHVAPYHHQLRSQVIQNDINEVNLLTDGKVVTGVIDFGDITYSNLISEVAIAMYYAGYDQEDFLHEGCLLLKQFHRLKPLTDEEIRMMFYKICLRSCQCRINTAVVRHNFPDNEYLLWKDGPHKATLKKLYSIDPKQGEKYIRNALDE